MTIDLDWAFQRLASEPEPPGLLGIEETVLARVKSAAADVRRAGVRLGAVAVIGAMGLGFAAAAPAETASPAETLAPFGADNPLAPSALLDL